MRTKSAIVFACGLAMFTVVQGQVQQQQQPPPTQTGAPPAGRQGGRGGGGGGRGGAPIPFDNVTGFDKIFDGATLTNWDGDPGFWRVEGGSIVGETTPDKPLSENTFLIYRGSEPDNFELKLEPVVGEPLLVQASGDAQLGQQLDRAVLEDTGAHTALDVLPAARLEHDGVDPFPVQKLCQHETGGAGAHDGYLSVGRAHSARSKRAAWPWPTPTHIVATP